jgi:DNA-binding NarL/FixJ family response regulator
MPKILLVDDHEMMLESLSLLVSTIDDMEVVAQLSDSRKVVGFLRDNEVDILVTDYTMPYINGVELALELKPVFPTLKILMLTVLEDVKSIKEAYWAGVSGYLMKRAGRAELTMALNTIAKGNKYFNESVLQELLNETPKHEMEVQEMPAQLTSREIDIIKLIATEYSTQDIADKLFISVGTVETHRHNILRKLNVKNAIGIARYAFRHRLA